MVTFTGNNSLFFCQACNRSHHESAGNRTLTLNVEENVVQLAVCDLQLFKYSEKMSKCFATEVANVKTMVSQKSKIINAEVKGEDTFKLRVAFAIMAFRFCLHKKLIADELIQYGIGKHFFDSCFQDGNQVIHEIMKAAKNDFWLDVQLRRSIPSHYDQWKRLLKE